MLKPVKDFIKTKPRLYDCLNSLRPINSKIDIWLDSFSKANNRIVNFIQVGASDGLRWDTLRRYIVRDNWKGVLIEPLYPVYKMLKKNYAYIKRGNLFFENCAISNGDGNSINFWSYSENFLNSLTLEERLCYLRKSSIDKKQVEKHFVGIDKVEEKIKCYEVNTMTLSTIIEKYCLKDKIDLIFIDAEGHDDYVIKTIDFEECLPKAILYEHQHLGNRRKDLESFLSKKGYNITQLGGDTVASR